MKILQILPGSGGTYYCENCLRDTALLQALRQAGQEMLLVPMYLPLYTDGPDAVRDAPVFFGGINVFLQQHLRLFRSTPRWIDRLLDARWLLGLAARREGATKPAGMGRMTLSMLQGPDGHQAKEIDRLVAWLQQQEHPDVVHLSSSMLLGLVRPLKEALGIPIVCSMQDEDTWIDRLDAPYPARCWEVIRERIRECDRLVTVSESYRDLIGPRLGLSSGQIDVVPIGIDLRGYEPAMHTGVPTLGYLSRLSPELGLNTLIEAFMLLKRRPGLEALRLHAMGGMTGGNRHFVARMERRLARAGMGGDVRFLEALDREARIAFLRELSVLSVPMAEGEAFGTFMLEAWAAGVPVVQPRAGAFPELVGLSGGGVVYEGATPAALADALDPLLRDPARARVLGERGKACVRQSFSVERMAERMVAIYQAVTAASQPPIHERKGCVR